MKLKLMYKVKRLIVKYKQKFKVKKERRILNGMNKEQTKVFNMVKDIVINNRNCVNFDPYSNEILIVLPSMLITIKHDMVYVDNTSGFLSTKFKLDAHDMLKQFIQAEIHRERRKLKHEVKGRIHNFITKITDENKETTDFISD